MNASISPRLEADDGITPGRGETSRATSRRRDRRREPATQQRRDRPLAVSISARNGGGSARASAIEALALEHRHERAHQRFAMHSTKKLR